MTQHNRRKEDALVARIDERLLGLDRSFTNHETEDHARFELVFNHMKESFDKIDKRLDKIDGKLENLWDGKNEAKGISRAAFYVVNAVWAIVAVFAGYWINRIT